MKKQCTQRSSATKRYPLGVLLMAVVCGSAALTFSLAAVSPKADSLQPGSTIGNTDRASATLNRSVLANPDAFHDHVNEIMRLDKSELLHVNVHPNHPLEGQLDVTIDGEPMTLSYWPHSVRSDDFRVWTQVDDGSLVEIEPAPERTIRGTLDEMPDSTVAGSLLDTGLHAGFNLPDGRLLWIEPLAGRVDGVDAQLHVLYDAEDADCEDGACGVPQHWFDGINDLDQDADNNMQFGIECETAEIAFDADWQFFTWLNSNTTQVTNYINNIVNSINNNQYEPQVGIVHEITEIVIRTSSAANPYTSNNAGTLLNQFRNVWRTSPESSIPRDMAHLMTGRNLGGTLGVAWLGSVCQSIHGFHYALSRNQSNFNCQTDLVAHETGHNWNANHCSCPTSTMNPTITCTNTFTGSGSNSVNQILSYKNSVNCLDPCVPPPPPANNECQDRIVVSDGSTSFSNVDATTEGPDEPDLCDMFSNTQIRNDVWFEYTATCTGEITVSLCSSVFATKLGIYEGSTCPTQPNTIAACDTTSCPANTLSEIIMPATEGESFIIRVGGRVDQTGSGTLAITCDEVDNPCPADLAGTGEVDVDDLFELLSQWGPCPDPNDCPADLTGTGEVDIDDLFELLSQWGPCP